VPDNQWLDDETMKHPELLLIPTFMLADYFLTLAGAVQKEKKYGDHFKTEHYELNPIWQRQVAQKKWFNPKHLLLTVAVTLFLILMAELVEMPEYFVTGVLGCLLVFFGMVVGRHLSNLMIFRYMIKKPQDISGQVTMTHALLLSLSLYQYLVVFVPLILIALFAPSPFVVGAVWAGVLQVLIHMTWISKYRKKAGSSNRPDAGGG
jgi:hypothetical protein